MPSLTKTAEQTVVDPGPQGSVSSAPKAKRSQYICSLGRSVQHNFGTKNRTAGTIHRRTFSATLTVSNCFSASLLQRATTMASAEGLFYKALAFVYYALGAYVGLITALVSAYLVLLADAYHLALDVIKHPGRWAPRVSSRAPAIHAEGAAQQPCLLLIMSTAPQECTSRACFQTVP